MTNVETMLKIKENTRKATRNAGLCSQLLYVRYVIGAIKNQMSMVNDDRFYEITSLLNSIQRDIESETYDLDVELDKIIYGDKE